MSSAPQLFDSDSEVEEVPEEAELKINKNYAKHYEEFRKKEELQKLKDKELELEELEAANGNDSSDSEEDDEPVKKPTLAEIEQLAAVMEMIKSHKTNSSEDFPAIKSSSNEELQKDSSKKKKKKNKFTLENRRQEMCLKLEAEEAHPEAVPEPSKNLRKSLPVVNLNEATVSIDDCFKPVHSSQEVFQEKQIEQEKKMHKKEQVAKRLANAFDGPGVDPFVRDFFFNQINAVDSDEEDPQTNSRFPNRPPPPDDDDNMHGFVYQTPDETVRNTVKEVAASVAGRCDVHRPKSYPAQLESTLRLKDTRRKESRMRKEERKEARKKKLKEEVSEGRALKMKEHQEKMKKIMEVAGLDDLPFQQDDLDRDFDPSEHDQKMAQWYDNEYYDEHDEGKPEFEYDEEIDGDFDNYDDFGAEDEENNEGDEGNADDYNAEGYGKGDFSTENDCAETLYSGIQNSKRRRKRRNKKFTEALLRKKPKFDPSQHEDFDKYFDEFYGLDFEDVIGDVKCRFKYKTVEPNDFGLSTEQILMADDKELNRYYKLRKMLRNDRTKEEEEKERKVFSARARNEKHMKKIFPSLYEKPEVEEQIDEHALINEAEAQKAEEERKRKKNLKKKLRRERKAAEETEAANIIAEQNVAHDPTEAFVGEIASEATEEQVTEVPLENGHRTENKKRKRENDDQSTPKKSKKKKHENSKNEKTSKEKAAAKQERKDRKVIDLKNPLSAALKISNERLAAYGMQAPAQLKRKAQYLLNEEKKGKVSDALQAFRTSDRNKQMAKKKKKKKHSNNTAS